MANPFIDIEAQFVLKCYFKASSRFQTKASAKGPTVPSKHEA